MEKTDNELIAEFMGGVKGAAESDVSDLWFFNGKHEKYLRYNSSWDWLMPVVEKIYEVQPQAFDVDHELGPLSDLAGLQICDGIESVYKAVVGFIKWYSSQPPRV